MKRTCALLPVLFLFCVFTAGAQTQVTIDSINPRTVCAHEVTWVHFTATGTFDPSNTFSVHLSDQFGDFNSAYTVLATQTGTVSGAFGVSPPNPSAQYRVRIVASKPYTISNSEQIDIRILPSTVADFKISDKYALTGQMVHFTPPTGQRTYNWIFDEGAWRATSTDSAPNMFYVLPGPKNVKLISTSSVGCAPESAVNRLTVFSCRPQIPSFVRKITDGEYRASGGTRCWVLTGALVYCADSVQVFAESGSIVDLNGASRVTVYAKNGAFVTGTPGADCIIIHAPQAGIPSAGVAHLRCDGLEYDYYAVTRSGGIAADDPAQAGTSVLPNPSAGSITVYTADQIARHITLVNALGSQVASVRPARAAVTLNTQTLPSGLYYVRITLNDGKTVTHNLVISN